MNHSAKPSIAGPNRLPDEIGASRKGNLSSSFISVIVSQRWRSNTVRLDIECPMAWVVSLVALRARYVALLKSLREAESRPVSHGGGTLIMLSEEDGWTLSLSAVTVRHAGIEPTWARLSPAAKILCPLFFLIDPWDKENEMARVAESLSEKKADRERREARLKRSQFEQSAPLSAASTWDFPKRDTYSAWVSSVCRGRCSEICSSSKAFLDLTV